jgi:tetratricopeptide (TPR) repeat protein
MDGRNLRNLAWVLLALTCGCASWSGALRPGAGGDAAAHKAPTYEAYANLAAAAAFAPKEGQGPQQQAQFREEAKAGYNKAIEVDPKYVPAYLGLARLQSRCEDYAGALATYDRALKVAPDNAALWHERGVCQCKQKNWQDAVTSFQKACELNPGDRQYVTMFGYTLGRAGRFQESLAVLAKVGGEAKAHYDLARLMRHMNQPELAKQQAALALSKDPGFADARQLLLELEGGAKPAIQTTAYQAPAAPPKGPDEPAPRAEGPVIENSARTAPAPATEASAGGQSGEGKPIRIPPRPVIIPGQGK